MSELKLRPPKEATGRKNHAARSSRESGVKPPHSKSARDGPRPLQKQRRKMPGFPTETVGTPTNRGKARRYKGQRRPRRSAAATKDERCRASRHKPSGPPQIGGKPAATKAKGARDGRRPLQKQRRKMPGFPTPTNVVGVKRQPSGPPQIGGKPAATKDQRCRASRPRPTSSG
jgi:hypothetical protein